MEILHSGTFMIVQKKTVEMDNTCLANIPKIEQLDVVFFLPKLLKNKYSKFNALNYYS